MTLRILAVHNRYLQPGGEDQSFQAEVALFRSRGHHVDEYVESNERIAPLGRFRTAVRTVWSNETYTAVRRLLVKGRHDLVSVQNWFPLVSPSVYYAARSVGVPVIQTLRNFRLLCVNGLFLRDGRPCEDCLGRSVAWPGVRHACYRGSHVGSAVVAGAVALHRTVGTWRMGVDRYVALNDFARAKFVRGGLPPERIVVRPNFLVSDPGPGSGAGGYAVYAGRLELEKGLDTVIAAWRVLGPVAPPLRVIGTGLLGASLRKATADMPRVEWVGEQSNEEVVAELKQARMLVFPSRMYENFPRTILEAFACGVPVIASGLGAMAELIRHGETGLLFEPGDPEALASCVTWVLQHPGESRDIGAAGRREYLERYTADANYRAFEDIWREIQPDTGGKERGEA